MNPEEVAVPPVSDSPRERPLDRRTQLYTSRNGSNNHGEYFVPAANRQLKSAENKNQADHVINSSALDQAPVGLVTRANSVDHFATVPRLTTTLKKTMTVRALFDYDPLTDMGLPSKVSGVFLIQLQKYHQPLLKAFGRYYCMIAQGTFLLDFSYILP
ncbi:hypothetical protein FBUS_11717 [Fasciolopsis buskii]|uniref:Uncharacterized protein n=1 Tax=Fasciolopsis buskii TaxID=27845 RepID=A0A8E0RT71_9TREM|nr:hypothetical protein FBUS_11717 [Fasciolopsis buski]